MWMGEPSTTATATATACASPRVVTKNWSDDTSESETLSWSTSATETSQWSTSATETSFDELSIDDKKKPLEDDPDDPKFQVVTTGEARYTSSSTFEELSLRPQLLKALYVEMKFQKPSNFQAISLPMILNPPHRDLIAQAHNGSGKTTCFVLGMLHRVNPLLQAPQALCICPTRESALQNVEVLRKMGKYTGISSEYAVPLMSETHISKRGPITAQVVIGTPVPILSWINSTKLVVTKLKILVFDEAHQMLREDGFDSLRIMKAIRSVNSNCQVLLFSAKFDDTILKFASKMVKEDHNELFMKKEVLSLDARKQYKVCCPDELSKIEVIKDNILKIGENVGQTIIFVRSRNNAEVLHKALVDLVGYEVTSIQGALELKERDAIVKEEFRDGLTQVLISTDVLARGFDQQQVNLVINYDLPVKHSHEFEPEPDCEVYLHRAGRDGRFGHKGAVFNLICGERDEKLMSKIENHFGTHVTEVHRTSVEDYKSALKKAGLLI